mgnify:FL=1|jgi:hypothetical protein|tara:strand:- start:456 stop:680 length:225 start_codon:yes stop_codon:yes gene_type:complete
MSNKRGINTSILIKSGPTSAGNGRGITPPTPASSGLAPTGSAHAVPINITKGRKSTNFDGSTKNITLVGSRSKV